MVETKSIVLFISLMVFLISVVTMLVYFFPDTTEQRVCDSIAIQTGFLGIPTCYTMEVVTTKPVVVNLVEVNK